MAPLFTLIRCGNFTSITTLGRSLITANTTVIRTASTKPIAFTDKVGMDKAIAAIINAEDHVAIKEALVAAEEALIEGTVKNKQPIKKELLVFTVAINPITIATNMPCNLISLMPIYMQI